MYIPMFYYYKGSMNSYVRITQKQDDMFELTTDYGELIKTVWSGEKLAEVLMDLSNDKYA